MTPNEKTLSDNMHKALGVRQAKHTPTPWHTPGQVFNPMNYGKPRNPYHKPEEYRAIGFGDGACHIGYVSVSGCVNEAEAKANAAFIIRACNCHDDLLAACKWAYAAICRRDGTESQYEVLAAPKTIEILQAAIAKAEGNL